MIKDYFLEQIETALKKAIENKQIGQLIEYANDITLIVERPKNADFGDYAVNVSSLSRYARIAPLQIANAIIDRLVHHCEIIKITGHSYRVKDRNLFDEDAETKS